MNTYQWDSNRIWFSIKVLNKYQSKNKIKITQRNKEKSKQNVKNKNKTKIIIHCDFLGYSKCWKIFWDFFSCDVFFLLTQHIHTILYWTQTLYQYEFHTVNDKQYIVNVKFSPKKENNSVYYFRERISLCSCDIVECRTNLMISTSHGLLNLQATMPSAISKFVMLMLCQFPSLSVHDSAVCTK